MATMWFDGIEELYRVEAELATGKARMLAKGPIVLRAATYRMQSYAMGAAPVDTGALRSSITVGFTGGLMAGWMEGVAGPEIRYGHYVEYGTERTRPQPYMAPALDRAAAVFAVAVAALADPMDRRAGVSAGGRLP
jgi:HK97 gp10 family phage protein